ncbi:MAG: hypothetical protein AB1656_22165 [Candidatus Omnitrophota bacterium]
MKKIFCLFSMSILTRQAFAQTEGESFFDKYLPIAKLFDSPVFFGIVIGSAILFLLAAYIFINYAKALEKRSSEWAKSKKLDEIVAALESPIPQEAKMAFVHLRKRSGEQEIQSLIERLQEQRRTGKINPSFIYLLEDLHAVSAVPLLEQIAKGKSQAASLAGHALDCIMTEEEARSETKA